MPVDMVVEEFSDERRSGTRRSVTFSESAVAFVL